MSLSQTEKECLKSVLEIVNGWSSPTAQWKIQESSRVLVPRQRNDEQQCRCFAGERKEDPVLMIVTNATDYIWVDQMSKVDRLMMRNCQIAEIGEFIVNPLAHRQPVQTLQQWFSWC